MGTKKTEDMRVSKKGVIIGFGICSVLSIIAIAAVIIFFVFGNDNSEGKKKRDVVINADNVDKVVSNAAKEIGDYVAPGSYEAKMNSEWIFADGESSSENAYVENVANNTHDVYFDVMLKDTEEIIYESPLLPRGAYLKNITLDKELEAGTYDCILIYHLVDENQDTVSTLRMGITIIVKE